MNTKKIRIALKTNASFSTISGLALVFFHAVIAKLFNIPQPLILLVIGIGLCLFALLVYKTASATTISEKMVRFIIIQDWLWVIGSILLILTQAFGISQLGFIIIGILALIVASFAISQQYYLKRA